jgi:tRNA A-37 threonylcarbamoyl transferase component Bud32
VVVLGVRERVLAGDVTLDAPDTTFDELGWTAPGAVLDGRFVVEGLLGRGGMGCVVLARHRELGELRAIKLLRHDRALNQRARSRLAREARAAARIRSAHVVRVFDVVVSEEESVFPYIVMEHLVGETLAARLGRERLSVPSVGRIVIEACEALAEAHAYGTVHRDLKPSNLFLTSTADRNDFVKVLDFGIAKTDEVRFDLGCTESHTLLATPAYASPEQLRASKDVDPRSDIWSLGVIIYQCLTGRLPFEDGTLAETSSRILRDPPSPLRQHCPEAPVEIEQLLARCLEKERKARLPSARALVEALAPFAPQAAASCLTYIDGLVPVPEVVTQRPASPDLPEDGRADRATLSQSSFATTMAPVRLVGNERAARAEPPGRRVRPRVALTAGVVAAAVIAGVALAAGVRSRHEVPAPRLAPAPAPATSASSPGEAPAFRRAADDREQATVSEPAGLTNVLVEPALSATTVPVAAHRRTPARRSPAAGAIHRAQPPASGPGEVVVPVGDLPIDQLIDGRK